MSDSKSISKGIRSKRFRVREDQTLTLVIETELSEKKQLKVNNCSLGGISAEISPDELTNSSLGVHKILPESKLVWADNEVPLGRLAIRTHMYSQDGKASIGFSCIDSKVPLFGPISKLFDQLGGGADSPLEYELSSKKFTLASFLETQHTHTDLFQRCKEYELLQQDLSRNPLYQYYAVRHQTTGNRVKLSLPRRKTPTDYVSFANYDYFGFSSDPEVREAAKQAIDKFGVSATATPPLAGNTSIHEELEHELARLLRKEDAILFTSGFAANAGTLNAILSINDLAIADMLSHASIHDGLSNTKARVRLFRHNSARHLRSVLEEHRKNHAGALVISEGLFSMDGDVPDLAAIVRAAKEKDCRVFLDEVHSFGVLGPNGLGAAERYGVLDDIDIFVGSLSKGFGAGGGFIAGSRSVTTWLRAFARTELFSSALSPGHAAAALKSVQLLRAQPERRKKLLENIKQFTDGLRALGYQTKSDPESPIVPVIIGDQELMGRMNEVLIDNGVFVNPIIYPAVAVNRCRLRFSISSVHSYADIQLALVALKRAFEVTNFDCENVREQAAAG